MLLKWNLNCIKVLALVPTTDDQKKVPLKRSQVNLLPGVNEIPDEEWDIAKQHVKDEVKRGDLEILAKDVAAGAGKVKLAKNLEDMPSNACKKLIGETSNPETLQTWEQEETREEIRLLIQRRMEKLKIDPASIEEQAGEGN